MKKQNELRSRWSLFRAKRASFCDKRGGINNLV